MCSGEKDWPCFSAPKLFMLSGLTSRSYLSDDDSGENSRARLLLAEILATGFGLIITLGETAAEGRVTFSLVVSSIISWPLVPGNLSSVKSEDRLLLFGI